MDAFRRILTGKTGDVHMIAFKDTKILDDTVLDEIRQEIATLLGKASGPDVLLDFGNGTFSGAARWLEIGVRTNGSSGSYTLLSPRQAITATPYAILANTAAGPAPGALRVRWTGTPS